MAKKSRGGEKVTLKIPRPLYERIGQIIEGAGYNSVTEFVVYVLRDLVCTHAMTESDDYSEEELERVKKRLETLGYL